MAEIEEVKKPGMAPPDGTIVEECWDGVSAYFYVKPGIKNLDVERCEQANDYYANRTLVPLVDDFLRKGFVKLPMEPFDYGTEITLFEDIRRFITKYVDLDSAILKVICVFVLLTWVYDKAPALPLISVRGGSETGKSRLGETLIQVCYRGLRSSGCLSFSSLFRTRENWGGTIYINEAEFNNSNEESLITKYLNESYEPGGGVWRTNTVTFDQEVFKSFGPVILVSRKGFMDDALESRCFVVVMTETNRKDIPLNLPPEFYEEGQILRNKLLAFRFKNYHSFENEYALRFEGVGPRLNQILQPIASLARIVSNELFEEIKSLAGQLQERLVSDRADSEDGLITRAYFRLDGLVENITASDIANEIRNLGADLTEQKIGRRLKTLPFKKYSTKDGKKKPYRVVEAQRNTLMNKYVMKQEREECLGTDGFDELDRTMERVSVLETVKHIKELVAVSDFTTEDLVEQSQGEYPNIAKILSKLIKRGLVLTDSEGVLRDGG